MKLVLLAIILFTQVVTFLIYLFATLKNGNLLLGATLPPERMEDPDFVETAKSFRRFLIIFSLAWALLTVAAVLLCPSNWALYFLFPAIFGQILILWRVYVRYIGVMLELKRKKNIAGNKTDVITIDTIASRLKEKQGLAAGWFFLPVGIAAVPVIWQLVKPNDNMIFLLSCVPLILALIFFAVPLLLKRTRTQVISEDTKINQLANAEFQYSWSRAYFVLSLLLSIVLGLAWLPPLFAPSSAVFTIAVPGVLSVVMVVFLFTTYNKIRKRYNELLALAQEPYSLDEDNYWKNGYYSNPYDKRLLVVKRTGIGMTLNFGNTAGKVIGIGGLTLIIGMLVLIMGSIAVVANASFSLKEEGGRYYTKAPFYNTDFAESEIQAVELVDSLPRGTRTNGFGLPNVSLGNYRIDGWGKAKLYLHTDTRLYVVISLPEQVVVINQKDEESTRELYQSLLR